MSLSLRAKRSITYDGDLAFLFQRRGIYKNMLIGLTQQGTRFRCLSQLILAVPAIESGVKLIHTNHIL